MAYIDELRLQTFLEANELLDAYGKACIIRPTGFGKTGILTKFIKEYTQGMRGFDNSVLYLYPTSVIAKTVCDFYYGFSQDALDYIPNVRFMSFMKLVKLSSFDMASLSKVKLIIADECHKLGGGKTAEAIFDLMERFPEAKFLGATATPIRMDGFDVVDTFYDNRVVSPYSLHDAFSDGILQKPYYCYCSYAIESDIEEAKNNMLKEAKGLSNKEKETLAIKTNARLIEISNLSRMENVIRNTCDNYAKDTSYMKGIFFFSSYKHMGSKMNDVIGWFKKAYPSHKINVIPISGENTEYYENRHKLHKLKKRLNTIDLILCVDMLNMGYHVNDLTFIGMFRGTASLTIYAQQLGRALSSGSSVPGIVFDLVDNLHSDSLYSLLPSDRDTLGIHIDDELKIVVERFKELQGKIRKITGDTKDLSVLSAEEQEEYRKLKTILNNANVDCEGGRWWTHSNDIFPEDLITTGHEGDYKALIRKIEAEPVAMRCRQAYTHWKEQGGDDGGGSADYICRTAYPPEKVPLHQFAKNKYVTVEMVLNEVFGGNHHDMAQRYVAELVRREKESRKK